MKLGSRVSKMFLFIHFFVFLPEITLGQLNISVNSQVVISNIDPAPLGLVLNQMTDGQLPLDSLKNAVNLSGSTRLRFPEGETADNYYFTDPLLINNPDPTTHRVANTSWWPAVGTSIANSKGHYSQGLNFDQFMSVVESQKAIANVVLCYPCGNKSTALDMAKAWVKYAKDKNYDIVNYEIGNETFLYNPNYTDDHEVTVNEYIKDLIEWSVALKAINPKIRIGANGNSRSWFKSLLTYRHPTLGLYGAQAIDFLVVHSYPIYGSTFSAYQQNKNAWGTLDFTGDVRNAINAMADSASTTSVSHINIAVTECSTMNYSSNDPNNLSSAIMTMDMLTEMIKLPQVEYIQLWASRWIYNQSSSTAQGSDSFSKDNQLNPSGLALSILSKFIGSKLLQVSGSTTSFKVFASTSSLGQTNIILINRSNSKQSINLNLSGTVGALSGKQYLLSGSDSNDLHPNFSEVASLPSNTNSFSLDIPGTSVSVLSFTSNSTTPTPEPDPQDPPPSEPDQPSSQELVLNPGFESSLSSWENWGGASVVKSNAKSGKYSMRLNSSGGSAGQIIKGVVASNSYQFQMQAKLSSTKDIAYVGVTFKDANGNEIKGSSQSKSFTNTSYAKISFDVTAPSSFTTVEIWVWKGSGRAYLYTDDYSLKLK